MCGVTVCVHVREECVCVWVCTMQVHVHIYIHMYVVHPCTLRYRYIAHMYVPKCMYVRMYICPHLVHSVMLYT